MYNNRVVVYTSGTFDMFHSNHLKMIEYARRLGDECTTKYNYSKGWGVLVFHFTFDACLSTTSIKKENIQQFDEFKSKIDHHTDLDIK